MMKVLEEDKNYFWGMGWLATAFNVGARRDEVIQFKTEILNYEIPKAILCHGSQSSWKGQRRSETSRLHDYRSSGMNNEDMTMSIYLLHSTVDNQDKRQKVGLNTFILLSFLISSVAAFNPHLFNPSCITYLLEVKKIKIELVSKNVAQHNDVSTTRKKRIKSSYKRAFSFRHSSNPFFTKSILCDHKHKEEMNNV